MTASKMISVIVAICFVVFIGTRVKGQITVPLRVTLLARHGLVDHHCVVTPIEIDDGDSSRLTWMLEPITNIGVESALPVGA